MVDYRVFTIGHGGRTLDEIVEQLRDKGVRFVVDVRSQPYSRYQPEFSKEALDRGLANAELQYLFMGDQLGGRPDDPSCYTENGNVDYDKCRLRPLFQEGVQRLLTGFERGHSLALLCSEGNPEKCHRSGLIGDGIEQPRGRSGASVAGWRGQTSARGYASPYRRQYAAARFWTGIKQARFRANRGKMRFLQSAATALMRVHFLMH